MVVFLTEPSYTVSHNFNNGPLKEELNFYECPGLENQGRFKVLAEPIVLHSGLKKLIMTVDRLKKGMDFGVKVTVESKYWNSQLNPVRYPGIRMERSKNDCDNLTSLRPTTRLLTYESDQNWTVSIKLDFKFDDTRTFNSDLELYFNKLPTVTLFGHDGDVTVSKIILEMRSEAFEKMFSTDMKERKTLTVDLKEFDTKTLQAFIHFLRTDELTLDKETVIGLYLLGDKYGIECLKTRSQMSILHLINELDRDQVCDIMAKTDPGFIKRLIATALPNSLQ